MKKIKLLAILIIIVLILTSCGKKEDGINRDESLDNQDLDNSSQEVEENDHIKQNIDEMDIDEKIGQLIIGGFEGQEIDESIKKLISEYKIGGLIFFDRNINDSKQTMRLINQIKQENSNNTYPLFLSIDEEGGIVSRLPSDYRRLPTALEVGNKGSEELSMHFGEILGDRLKSLGFNLDFAPILDIYSNPDNTVIGDRAFGKDIEQVKINGLNVIDGLRSTGVIPTVKHFPGHGDTVVDSHLSLPKVQKTLAELKEFELKPFEYAIEKDIEMIMVAHLLYPEIDAEFPSSMSDQMIDGILREEMNYKGVIISDDMTMNPIIDNYGVAEASLKFLQAGGDIALICHGEENIIASIDRIKTAIENDELKEDEIDDKLYRIISIKEQYSLNDEIIENLNIDDLDRKTLDFLDKFK